jgi:adenylosuccinate synthase
VLPDGRRHVFSQFGAGALTGAATYLGEQMIINPPAMHKEAVHLKEMTGEDPFDKLIIHPRVLVSTIYHQELNRLRELSRGANRHGSCGHGIGETRNYWLKYGSDAVFASDLHDREALFGKMELIRQRVLLEVQDFLDCIPADEHWRLTIFAEPARRAAKELFDMATRFSLQSVMPHYTTAIFEGAQGVLLDEWRGFHPHTTWSTVTQEHALDMVEESDAEELNILGVTRAYATRHGAGPFPTSDSALDTKLTDPGNPKNDWQGTIRRGWLDLVLLRYASDVTGGTLGGLVLNGLDELAGISPQVCTGYKQPDGRIIRRLPFASAPSLTFQQSLTSLLQEVEPIYETMSMDAIQDRLASELGGITITARGTTWLDRTLHELRFDRIKHGVSSNDVNQYNTFYPLITK